MPIAAQKIEPANASTFKEVPKCDKRSTQHVGVFPDNVLLCQSFDLSVLCRVGILSVDLLSKTCSKMGVKFRNIYYHRWNTTIVMCMFKDRYHAVTDRAKVLTRNRDVWICHMKRAVFVLQDTKWKISLYFLYCIKQNLSYYLYLTSICIIRSFIVENTIDNLSA